MSEWNVFALIYQLLPVQQSSHQQKLFCWLLPVKGRMGQDAHIPVKPDTPVQLEMSREPV